MAAIINSCHTGRLQAVPAVVVSNNKQSGALRLAKQEGVPSFHLSLGTHKSVQELDHAITQVFLDHSVDFVVLAGYLRKVGPVFLQRFAGRAFNIHPSLLPKYGGLGMYGMLVHEAVLEAGEQETGATVHLVNAEYDQGKICAKKKVRVHAHDTPQSLAKRVLALEHELYTNTLKEYFDNGQYELSL